MFPRTRLLVLLCPLAACFDLELPPPPGPGTVQGTLVYAEPGRPGFRPAAASAVVLLGTGFEAKADDDGHFLLKGIVASRGTLLASFDSNHDGIPERQRLLDLSAIGAGPGRDLALGDVVLARNTTVTGRVKREGTSAATGLGGTAVFVPGAPWSTWTNDDGSFVLTDLPEGRLQVSFFAEGFAVDSLEAQLSPAEERALPTVTLMSAPPGLASVAGRLLLQTGAPATDAHARMRGLSGEPTLSVTAEGKFAAASLKSGLYSFAFERTGSLGVGLYNILLPPGETDLGALTLYDGTSSGVMLPTTAGYDGGAGTTDAGATDAGVDAGMDAGNLDAGEDAGSTVPVAVATGPALAGPNSLVTISGMSSTGSFPLVYKWTQRSGATVALSGNDTALSHSPTFTAPAAGNLLEFELVVVDRFGVSSAPATIRIGIGVTPVARFVPDGGLVFGGQLVQLTSTSFDDAGVALVAFDWQLATGSGGTLTTDGGPSAQWRTPAVAYGAMDQLGGVTLRVTNAVGAKSAPFTQYSTVRGANPNNWSIDAGPQQNVLVGPVPGQVVLAGSVSTAIPSPQYAVNWSCSPGITLVGGDTLTPRFVTPAVTGPTVNVTCQVQATGQPPLDPPTITSSVNVLLRDATPPQVARHSVEALRMSRFGIRVTATEPLSDATLTVLNCNAYGLGSRITGASALFGQNYGVVNEGDLCGPFSVQLVDRGQPTNSATMAFGPAGTIPASAVWTGPWESTASFDDPRPIAAALGPLSEDQLLASGVNPAMVPSWELLATQAGQLIRFSGLDVNAAPTCSPSCALTSTPTSASSTGTTPAGNRVAWAGAELFVFTATDGGLAPTAAHRDRTGTWSNDTDFTGAPGSWDHSLRTVHLDAGALLLDTWDPSSRAFTTTDLVATGLASVSSATTLENLVVAATGTNRALLVRKRNVDGSWSTVNTGPTLTDISSILPMLSYGGLSLVGLEHGASQGLSLQRVEISGGPVPVSGGAAVQGYDAVLIGNTTWIVYSQGGDIHFKWVAGYVWSGAGGGAVDFGGPPRPGYLPPLPVVLDANPLCEAVYPRLAIVNEALVITWQERCAPATQWKVMARVVR